MSQQAAHGRRNESEATEHNECHFQSRHASRVGGEKPDFTCAKIGGDDETRTRDLCRDSVAWLGFTRTYNTAGTAKLRGSRTRHLMLWVGLWVGIESTDPGAAPPWFPRTYQELCRRC